MPIDTTPSNVATSALQSIPFGSIIGGPLDAAIEAQAQAAQTSWNFIREVGLSGSDDNKRAVTVDFIYQSQGKLVRLVVPLLAIVPIPYIAIDNITIDFKANIDASSSTYQKDTSSEKAKGGGSTEIQGGLFGGAWGFGGKASFNASYSSKKDSTATQKSKYSVEYTIDVHLGASQSDMPAGLAAVLNILQSSITPTIPEANIQVNPKTINLGELKEDDEKEFTLTITGFDNQGLRAKKGDKVTFKTPNVEGDVELDTLKANNKDVSLSADTEVELNNDGEAVVTGKVKGKTPSTPPVAGKITIEVTGTFAGEEAKAEIVINVAKVV